MIILYLLLLLFGASDPGTVVSAAEQDYILKRVNAVREHGCYCGDTFMRPVNPVAWNSKLYKSAMSYAREMTKHGFFGHYGARGENIGERLDAVKYLWEVAGENLGEGQKTFDEVLRDWKDSESHCRMLMNPRVNEMAVAKHEKFWVQHWGKQMPEGAVVD